MRTMYILNRACGKIEPETFDDETVIIKEGRWASLSERGGIWAFSENEKLNNYTSCSKSTLLCKRKLAFNLQVKVKTFYAKLPCY